MRQDGNTYRKRVEQAPATYTRMQEHDEIVIGDHTWRVIVGAGHVPEHVCLYSAALGVLISGDQVLPKITPNISLWANDASGDPLGDYLDSLVKFEHLPPDTLVLPSHQKPFYGLHARLAGLADHHAERLDDVIAACDGPMTATDFLPVLFKRKLDLHQMGFAMGEGLAHLTHLVQRGRLGSSRRDDGVTVYQRP
jgi:glyoxylase-like metal-dependent hydrolase (beta-lactamase superfamily II)